MRFQLWTANKYEAAAKARAIYQSLVANGWDQTLGRFKKAKAPRKIDVTIGEFLAELRTLHASRARTIEGYGRALRTIAAAIAGLPRGGRGGSAENHRAWREQVDALKLSLLTPSRLQKWREAFLVRDSGNDPVKQRAARVSANSFMKQARSLFSAKYLERLDTLLLPEPLPFAGVKFERRSMPKYQSNFDVMELVRTAARELAASEPKQFKVFVLAVMAGLRRGEIDKLEWARFNWAAGTINVSPTEFFRTKSEDSIRSVWIPPEMLEIFRGFHARALSRFVIESDVRPATDEHYNNHYRCETTFSKLIAWLRNHGVGSKKPLHALRKEFGSLIAARYGIYAAKEMLGHADITTTAAHYLEVKEKPMIGLGHLLPAPAQNAISFVKEKRKKLRRPVGA